MDLANEINFALPLHVSQVDLNDPQINIFGLSWNLMVACPWSLSGPGIRLDWASGSLEQALVLVGMNLEAVMMGPHPLADLTFCFSGGFKLRVAADSGSDPWVLRVPGGIYVGEMNS
jgi:hypothetical protein